MRGLVGIVRFAVAIPVGIGVDIRSGFAGGPGLVIGENLGIALYLSGKEGGYDVAGFIPALRITVLAYIVADYAVRAQ